MDAVAPGRLPAVVFIAVGGGDGSAQTPVAGLIQRRTGAELVTVDRAGFGDSDEDVRYGAELTFATAQDGPRADGTLMSAPGARQPRR